jgi:hypothetical protein
MQILSTDVFFAKQVIIWLSVYARFAHQSINWWVVKIWGQLHFGGKTIMFVDGETGRDVCTARRNVGIPRRNVRVPARNPAILAIFAQFDSQDRW